MGGHCDYVSMDIPCGCIFDSNFEYEVFCVFFLSFGNYCQYRDTIYKNTITL